MFAFFIGPFLVITGAWAVGTGVSLAVRPHERKLVSLRLLTVSSGLASISALCGGLVNTFVQVADGSLGETLDEIVPRVAGGLAEAVAAPMVGAGLLAVAWLAAAVGMRRSLLVASAVPRDNA